MGANGNPIAPGVPSSQVYTGCGKNPNTLRVRMGLSRGWGDLYRSSLPDQYIDITGLVSGSYRLTATADAANWFSRPTTPTTSPR